MAIVTRQSTGEQFHDSETIATLLDKHGLVYERWNIDKLQDHPQPADKTVQEHILDVFEEEIQALCETRGYQTADVIALTPQTENLEDLLAKFDKEHRSEEHTSELQSRGHIV